MAAAGITINLSGPLLTRNVGPEIRAMMREACSEVADQASADLHHNMEAAFRHPTPYYETQLHRFRHGQTEFVGDRGVIYGPWLEGTGSRNRTTRFKGYASFRRATQSATAAAPRLADAVIRRNLGRLK